MNQVCIKIYRFSVVGALKTAKMSRLSPKNLSNVMMIKYNQND